MCSEAITLACGSRRSDPLQRHIHELTAGLFAKLLEQGYDLFLQSREIPCNRAPDDFSIDSKIVVNQNVTHADYFRPRYVRRRGAEFFRQQSSRFTDDLKMRTNQF